MPYWWKSMHGTKWSAASRFEQVFAQVKTLLRKVDARTRENLDDEIAKLIKIIAPSECANYFRNAGYKSA